MPTSKVEFVFLTRWKLILAILTFIITPSVTVTGAYWKLKTDMVQEHASADKRISEVELTAQKSFAEKDDLKDIQNKINQMHDDIMDIKSMIRNRR